MSKLIDQKNFLRDLKPFWENPKFPDEDFYLSGGISEKDTKLMIISGPSRNGNHLVHSLLDSHPSLPRIPGEDSFLNYSFDRFLENFELFDSLIKSERLADILLTMSSRRKNNKWLTLHKGVESSSGDANKVWSGVQYREKFNGYVFDYQDTYIPINYPHFENFVRLNFSEQPQSLFDLYMMYFRALGFLDPEYKRRKNNLLYNALTFGSGTRGPLDWLMSRSSNIHAIVPLRSFETFYFSFAKGFFGKSEVNDEILKEAWEHWWHKAVDYYILKKRYPDQIYLVLYEEILRSPHVQIANLCEFFDLKMSEMCETTTTLGYLVKGNSSYGQKEKERGKIYKTHINDNTSVVLKKIPDYYLDFWATLQSVTENQKSGS